MKPIQITTSAALFYDFTQHTTVSVDWFRRAVAFLDEFELSPVLFTARGGKFDLDDCCVLAEPGGDLQIWGEPIPARRDEIIAALTQGDVKDLTLDAPRNGARDRSDWRGKVSDFPTWGELYMGIDDALVSDPLTLVRLACEVSRGLFTVHYGFGYTMPLPDAPASYAIGSRPVTFSDIKQQLGDRRKGIERPTSADDLWRRELSEERRHLKGFFRGAYPANVLSAAHVRAADLVVSRIGELSQLDDSLWLWELSSEELPLAEEMLRAYNLLVAQL